MKISLHSFRKVKDEKVKILEDSLFQQIKEAQMEIAAAECLFEYASDPLQVDQAILAAQVARKKYSYLMKIIREDGGGEEKLRLLRPWHVRLEKGGISI